MNSDQELFPEWENADHNTDSVVDRFGAAVQNQGAAKQVLADHIKKCVRGALENAPAEVKKLLFYPGEGLAWFYGLPIDAALDGGVFEILRSDPQESGAIYGVTAGMYLSDDNVMVCAVVTKQKTPGGKSYAWIDGRWTGHWAMEETDGATDCELCPERGNCRHYSQIRAKERAVKSAVKEIRRVPEVARIMRKYGTEFFVSAGEID